MCPYCVDFECVECQFCTKFYHNGQRIIKRSKIKEMGIMSFKEKVDNMTDLIISCWDSNQELDENGKPVDGLTFDERLAKKMEEVNDNTEKAILTDAINF